MTSTEIRPTDEQTAIITAFATGENMLIEAGAGTGKTSTLCMVAESTDRSGTYVVYNKAAQLDAKASYPGNVDCRTAHSLAYGGMMRQPNGKQITQRAHKRESVPSKTLIRPLGIPAGYESGEQFIPDWVIASTAVAAVRRYIQSADDEITAYHVPPQDGIEDQADFKEFVLPFAKKVWEDNQKPNGFTKVTPDHYLKMWALTKPSIKGEFLMLDEAQDTNGVLLKVIMDQSQQKIVVGDRCQPAGTMVTVVREGSSRSRKCITEQVPIETIREGDTVVSYDIGGAFLRRSGSQVLGVSSRPYHHELRVVSMADGQTSRYTDNHRCVVRIAPALRDKWVVYLMRRGQDYRLGIAPGLSVSQGNRPGFLLRAGQEKADAMWILSLHDSRSDAAIMEQKLSGRFHLPQLLFTATGNSVMTQNDLDEIWNEIGNNHNKASILLRYFDRDISMPLWQRGDENLLIRRATVIDAINLIDGMEMLPLTGAMDASGKRVSRNQWEPIVVTKEKYHGLVYSLNVANDHTYVADGIITHNCQQLYAWRGAINAMTSFEATHNLCLSRSFRFGQAIADNANKFLDLLRAPLRLVGFDKIDSKIAAAPLTDPDAILCRTNATVIQHAMAHQARGKRVAIVGGTTEIEMFAKGAQDLQQGRRAGCAELAAFSSWSQVQAYAGSDEGADMRVMVKLIDNYGVGDILLVCAQSVSENSADIIVTTAHKSKGREWNRVKIAEDFEAPKEGESPSHADLCLCYVAVTRAKLVLDPGALIWVDTYTSQEVAA